VLQQVREEEIVRRDRLQRRVERDGDEQQPDGERERPPRAQPASHRARVEHGRGDGEDEKKRLEAEPGRGRRAHGPARPGRGAGAGRRRATSRSRNAAQIPSVSSCSRVIRIPASCWSRSGEMPHSRTCWWAYAGYQGWNEKISTSASTIPSAK